jgi:hypothetical protein
MLKNYKTYETLTVFKVSCRMFAHCYERENYKKSRGIVFNPWV